MSRPIGSKNKKTLKKLGELKKDKVISIIEPIVVPIQDNPIKLKLNLAGVDYFSEGNSVMEAFSNLKLHFLHIKTKGTMWITRGDKTVEKFMFLKPLRNIVRNISQRKYWATMLEKLLNQK